MKRAAGQPGGLRLSMHIFANALYIFRADHVDNLQAQADAFRAAQVETQKELDALMPGASAKAFAGELWGQRKNN